MAKKKKSTTAGPAKKKRTQRKTKATRTRSADKKSRRTPPAQRPAASGEATPLHPAVGLIVSLLAPGLGLLLLERRDRVKDAFLIFGLWFSYVALSFFLTFVFIGVCCWLPLPLLNLAAGIHSFDEMTLEQGGVPVVFQSSFRIFRDEQP